MKRPARETPQEPQPDSAKPSAAPADTDCGSEFTWEAGVTCFAFIHEFDVHHFWSLLLLSPSL